MYFNLSFHFLTFEIEELRIAALLIAHNARNELVHKGGGRCTANIRSRFEIDVEIQAHLHRK